MHTRPARIPRSRVAAIPARRDVAHGVSHGDPAPPSPNPGRGDTFRASIDNGAARTRRRPKVEHSAGASWANSRQDGGSSIGSSSRADDNAGRPSPSVALTSSRLARWTLGSEYGGDSAVKVVGHPSVRYERKPDLQAREQRLEAGMAAQRIEVGIVFEPLLQLHPERDRLVEGVERLIDLS